MGVGIDESNALLK